ncbi:MAG: hypothetical protein Q9188_000293 [Gyalolechia gomerana]
MPSESDPLLPQYPSAPEISGNGHRRKPRCQSDQAHVVQDTDNDKETAEASRSPGEGPSPLRVIVILFTSVVGLGLLISFLSSDGFRGKWKIPRTPEDSLDRSLVERVDKILFDNPLFDGHNDLAILIRFLYKNQIYDPAFTKPFEEGGLEMHVDLPRLKAGKVGATFWSAFVLCPTNGTDFSDEAYAQPVSMTLSQIDLLRRLTAAYPQVFSSPDLNSSSATDAFRRDHLLISPIAIEGLHQIGNRFSNLRLYYSLGVRYATLTHNCHNAFADAALVTNASGTTVAASPYWGGVSEKGKTMVQEMNRLGMLVDLSHVSKDTMMDVLGGRPEEWSGSRAPVIFSHSSAFALCPHPRNVPDDVLELVKTTNSVVMVNFSPDFISCVPSNSTTGLPELYHPNSTLRQVARHVQYIGDLIGYDHVGLGSDFDGIFTTPKGLEDVSKFPDLVLELLKMGVSDDDAAKLVGRNVLRVWSDVEGISSQMQDEGVLPAEDKLGKLVVQGNTLDVDDLR